MSGMPILFTGGAFYFINLTIAVSRLPAGWQVSQ